LGHLNLNQKFVKIVVLITSEAIIGITLQDKKAEEAKATDCEISRDARHIEQQRRVENGHQLSPVEST
jgi:hypothetical protein